MKSGWLINDCLTCIPNTKTFWHDLLENIPNLRDMTGGYTDFYDLPHKIEQELMTTSPHYIIRNCTFFRKLNTNIKTISILQDYYPNNFLQLDVANNSDIVVFNSPFTQSLYNDTINSRMMIIPLGVDSNIFTKTKDYSEELKILPNSILFVGASNNYPKGFDLMMEIINNTDYNFCLVMKDDFKIDHPRIRVFNKIDQNTIIKVYNSCKMILCTSKMETQHLGGIEAALCGLPIIATNVGSYYNIRDGSWGMKANNVNEFIYSIKHVFENYNNFNSRDFFIKNGYTKNQCMNTWKKLIEKI